MKHPGEMSWSFGPGPAVMDARRTEETRQKYADVTTRMWAEAWTRHTPTGAALSPTHSINSTKPREQR